MKSKFLILTCFLCLISFSQTKEKQKFNLNFDLQTTKEKLPDDWVKWGNYELKSDTVTKYSGKQSALIESGDEVSFGSIAYKLPSNYKGKKITLEGYMKLENVTDGFAGLLLRVDKDGKSIAFDNMQNKDIKGTKDWEKYSITLKLDKTADHVFVAGILVGKGKVWFDAFKVTIDGKDINDLKQVDRELPLAEKDKEFDLGSKINLSNLNETQKKNLFVLGKVWGFVKYHHPEIAAGNVNWDYELFRILPKIDSKNFDKELIAWITKLGPFKTEKKSLPKEEDIKLKPRTEWISNTNLLSNELSSVLQKINQAERKGKSYYIELYPGVGNPNFTNEKTYYNMEYTDSGVKLLALFRYWNMMEYFNPNRHLLDENWDQVLHDFIPKIIEGSDELTYKLNLLELIGKTQDSHASIWGKDKTLDTFYGNNIVPVEVRFVEEQLIVTTLHEEFKDKNLSIGDVITEINGIKVTDWIKNNLKYSPASNYPTQLRNIARKILRTNASSLDLKIQTNSGSSDVTVNTVPNKYWKKEPNSHKLINDNIGYIYPGTLGKKEIDTIMNKFLDKKGLIIDLRCYPSDFIVFSLTNYLLNEKKQFVEFTTGNIKTPGLITYRSKTEVGGKNKDCFKGKVIILVNEITQSNAEYTTMAIRVAPNATVLGSTTSGADGNVSAIYLPGNVFTYVSGIGVLNPDRTETQRVGIIPDIEIKPTIKGIRAGKDEVLEKAIELINQ